MDFLWHLIFKQHVDTKLVELVIITAWSVWLSRNNARLGKARQSLLETTLQTRSLLYEYRLAHTRPTQLKKAMDGHWVPPTFPWYKVNVDAAVFSHLGVTGISVIIRDHFGSVIAALSKCLPLPLAPLEAEAKALDEAMVFAWEIGVKDVIF